MHEMHTQHSKFYQTQAPCVLMYQRLDHKLLRCIVRVEEQDFQDKHSKVKLRGTSRKKVERCTVSEQFYLSMTWRGLVDYRLELCYISYCQNEQSTIEVQGFRRTMPSSEKYSRPGND